MADNLDPYDVLGLRRDANLAAVKAAYRRLVKTSHPDAGGDAAVFDRIQRAYDCLSDPEARKTYDESGKMPGGPDLRDTQAMTILAGMIESILAGDQDPLHEEADLILSMRATCDDNIRSARIAISRMQRAQNRADRLKKKMIRKGEGDNLLHKLIDANLAKHPAMIASANAAIEAYERVKVLLEDYEGTMRRLAQWNFDNDFVADRQRPDFFNWSAT